VLKGSKASIREAPSIPLAIKGARAQMVQAGLFKEENGQFLLLQDYVFTSPSKASSVFLGRASNGRVNWRSSEGKTLKEIQETD
jgi:hypothetical protein